MRKRISPRETKRMMKRMGIDMRQMPEVKEVVLRTSTKEIIVEKPEVSVLDLHGQKIFQVIGETVVEKSFEKKMRIPEEDIRLVADQTGRSLEEAKAAIEETEGDLAKAILLLQTKRER